MAPLLRLMCRSLSPLSATDSQEKEIGVGCFRGQNDTPKSAKTVSFPANHPLISVSIPDGWTTPGASLAGSEFPLLIIPPKGIDGKVSLYLKDKVTDPQGSLKKTIEYAEEHGTKWESRGEAFELNGMKGFTAKGSGTKNGENWRISELILSPDGKHYFSISIQFKEGDLPSITPALEAIMNSIKPLKAPAK